MADSDSGDKKAPKYVYHYTSKEGLERISEDGVIKQSTAKPGRRDIAYGEGVYVTAKEPEKHSSKELLHNNYDMAAASKDTGRVSHYIQLDAKEVGAEKCSGTNRDVYIVRGDINLEDVKHRVGKTADK